MVQPVQACLNRFVNVFAPSLTSTAMPQFLTFPVECRSLWRTVVVCRDTCATVGFHLCMLQSLPPINLPCLAFQKHWDFYHSLFKVCCNTPRTLMHLSRCAIRKVLNERCHNAIPLLSLPLPLKKYLLLEPEGIIY